jgi:hypothetical protein
MIVEGGFAGDVNHALAPADHAAERRDALIGRAQQQPVVAVHQWSAPMEWSGEMLYRLALCLTRKIPIVVAL